MNLEEAMARIAESEEQNRRLSGIKTEQRSRLPVDAVEIAPFLFTAYGRPYNYYAEINELSHAIRTICFPTVRKLRRYKDGSRHSDCAIQLVDMTTEQYNAYLGVMTSTLRAIAECRKTHLDTTEEGQANHDSGD